jgi:hypothetical protein
MKISMETDLDLSLEVISASYFNLNLLQSAMKTWWMEKYVDHEMLYSNRSSKNKKLVKFCYHRIKTACMRSVFSIQFDGNN